MSGGHAGGGARAQSDRSHLQALRTLLQSHRTLLSSSSARWQQPEFDEERKRQDPGELSCSASYRRAILSDSGAAMNGSSEQAPSPATSGLGSGPPPEGAATAESFKEQGNLEYRAGRFLKAAALYTQALKADPGNAVLYRRAPTDSCRVCDSSAARISAVNASDWRGL